MTGRFRMVRYWGTTVLVAMIILAAGIGQTNLGHTILQEAGVTGRTTGYTSLAFSDPQFLRSQLGSKPAKINVSFVIQNTGATPHDYQWSVSLTRGQRRYDVATGSVHIPGRHRVTITRSTINSCTRRQIKIAVSLAEPAESIGAWIACSQPSRSKSASAQLSRPLPKPSR